MNRHHLSLLLLLLLITTPCLAEMARTPSPEDASVYIISPADATRYRVHSPCISA